MDEDILYIGVGGGKLRLNKKERTSNLELYRIIVMMLIVAHHYVVNSGMQLIMAESPLSTNSIFFYIFGAWGKTGIDCFVLITGFFMCKTEITLRKFLKLIIQVLTYNVLISVFFYMLGYNSLQNPICLFPMRVLNDDFTSCFLVFYLCIPFLNILVRSMNKKTHKLLICLLLFIYTIHALPGFEVTKNYVSWFSALYVISSYLRLYPLNKDNDSRFWGWMTLLSWGVSVLSILSVLYLNSIGYSLWEYRFIADSNAILALTNGITSFMWFKNLKIKNSKIINTIAASSFGVLLIHANSGIMRQWLWKDTVDCIGHYNTDFYWLYAIGCVLIIYIICTIIDYIRIKTIETPLLNITESLCMKVYSYFKCKL